MKKPMIGTRSFRGVAPVSNNSDQRIGYSFRYVPLCEGLRQASGEAQDGVSQTEVLSVEVVVVLM